MRAAILTATRQVEIRELPVPDAGPGEVLIRVHAAGICGAELHAFIGTHPFRKPPLQMGHEMAGEVVEVGPGVTILAKGDRVSVLPPRACSFCSTCMNGAPNLCENKLNLGTSQWPGCFADYITAPEGSAFKIPSHVIHQEAAIAEPLSIAVHAVRRVGSLLGGSVAVLGVGTIGLACVAAARESGAMKIVAADISDFNLKVAQSFGASLTINSRKMDPITCIKEATGNRGVDSVIVTAGVSSVLNQAIAAVRTQGTIVIVALFDEVLTVDQHFSFMAGEKILTTSWASSPQDFRTAIDLIASGRIETRNFITHRIPLEKVKEGLELLENRNEDCIKIMLEI